MTLKEDVCVQAVKTALQIGYRHLDTAAFYGNETENGEGLRQSGIKREEVFICTKVRQGDLMPDAFAKVLEQSLANLKLPYVDLLLIHWNNPDIPLKLSVGALCKAKKEGKTKHIGVANFTTAMAGAVLSAGLAPPSLVFASATAFLLSEFADFAVYTPLARRRLVAAVIASSVVGLIVDSIAFLWLAFGSLDFLFGQIIGKLWMVLLAIPFVAWMRRRDERLGLNPA